MIRNKLAIVLLHGSLRKVDPASVKLSLRCLSSGLSTSFAYSFATCVHVCASQVMLGKRFV